MRRINKAGGIAIVAIATLAVRAGAQITTRVSVASDGTEADLRTFEASISGDGRCVVFVSDATNLVTGDTNNTADVFVHDRQTGVTERVSVSSSEAQANGRSNWAAISEDGNFVVFTSSASNLVAGDTNFVGDVFVRDRVLGLTERVSVGAGGVEANAVCGGSQNAISADGRFVAFPGAATNLVAGDTNGVDEVFLRDRLAGTTERISLDSGGGQANGHSTGPSLSADGRFVAFRSIASNLVAGDTNGLYDAFVKDRTTGAVTRVSVSTAGTQANGSTGSTAISSDGSTVAFQSFASNLVPGDTNAEGDVFVRALAASTTERASVSSAGVQGDDSSSLPSLSATGRFVAFSSGATTLIPDDVSFGFDVFVRDRLAGTTELVSADMRDRLADDESSTSAQAISSDGRYVAMHSRASNLVPEDLNFEEDAFVRDRLPCASGNVNAVPGPVTDVLFVNDEARAAFVPRRQPIDIDLLAAPSGPNPADYVVYLTLGGRTGAFGLTIGGDEIGCTVNPTPFDPGLSPQPFKCLKGGFGPEYAGSVKVMNISPASAPWSRSKPGFGRPIVLTLQGVIEDASSPSGKSVTNAVTLEVF